LRVFQEVCNYSRISSGIDAPNYLFAAIHPAWWFVSGGRPQAFGIPVDRPIKRECEDQLFFGLKVTRDPSRELPHRATLLLSV
jgi:hypothetical protein